MEISKKINEIKWKLEMSKYKYWWHYFLAVNENTREERPFFIQYYVVNPEGSTFEPKFSEPSYAMVRAGTWENGGVQVSNFYGGNYFNIKNYVKEYQILIGHCIVSENYLKGKVYLGENCAEKHNEFMSNCGEFSWELEKKNRIPYNVENNIISIASNLERFNTEFIGHIEYNGQEYKVIEGKSNGYEMKVFMNADFGFWININCNSFESQSKEKVNANLNLIGLAPIILKRELNKEFSLVLNLEGKEYKYSNRVLGSGKICDFSCDEDDEKVTMYLEAVNDNSKIQIFFQDKKENMMKLIYKGLYREQNILNFWNSGCAKGFVKLYEKSHNSYVLRYNLKGSRANFISYI